MTCVECQQWASVNRQEAIYGLGTCKADNTPVGRARAFPFNHACHRTADFKPVDDAQVLRRRAFIR
jgi:hypothetical protein